MAWLGVLLLAAGTLLGCDGESSTEQSADVSNQANAETGDVAEEDREEEDDRRSAFGLPFPPKVHGVGERGSTVEVATRMKIDQLVEFFDARLVDYEILRPEKNRIRVVGLRKYMAEIRGHRYGPFTTLFYYRDRQEPSASADAGDESRGPDAGGPSSGQTGSPGASAMETSGADREPGSPVELRTPDGDLLAPGARWGEPYTPPEGSPLDHPRFESNFGRPFGEWDAP